LLFIRFLLVTYIISKDSVNYIIHNKILIIYASLVLIIIGSNHVINDIKELNR